MSDREVAMSETNDSVPATSPHVYVELDHPDNITEHRGRAAVAGSVALVITDADGEHVGYPLSRVLSWAQTFEALSVTTTIVDEFNSPPSDAWSLR